jgi:hypothetical protein
MARKRNRVMRFRITLIMARTLFLITLLLFSSPLFASDGVLEINHTCAMETGCFAGDTPGYPVTITEGSTSYVLTSKLIIANAVTTGIQINANNVSIDLNQFAIILSFCDDGSTSDCTPLAGTGVGVRSSGLHYGNSLKDGSIIGMGYRGVELGQGSSVTNLLVQWNRASGIVVGPDSIVTGNRVRHNGVIGILASGSVIENNHVSENDSDGISAGTSTVIGNVIVGNGESNSDHGIFCQRCLIRENNVYGHAGFGLSLDVTSA